MASRHPVNNHLEIFDIFISRYAYTFIAGMRCTRVGSIYIILDDERAYDEKYPLATGPKLYN